jgi:CheY-like chemotaxis protein
VGSTFTIEIPYALGRAPQTKQKTDTEIISGKPRGGLRVLLVEDNDINRLYAESVLKTWKCKTDSAENGVVAIEKLKNNRYDVVLMDVQMPVMDGYEAAKAVRLLPGMKELPIIALTANATQADIEKCKASGMDDYLSKPFTPDDLFQKLFIELKIESTWSGVDESGKKLFDLDYLRKISGGNEEFVNEMIQTFIHSIPKLIAKVEESALQKDWPNVSRIVHQIKPSLTLLGIHSLREKASLLEEQYKHGKPSVEIQRELEAFINTSKKAIAAMKELA